MNEKTEEQKEILRDYKTAERKYCGRTINDCLRNEESITDTICKEEINKVVSVLEGMMTEGHTPNVLYRALENAFFHGVEEGGVISDRAFLSTTSDMSCFMRFTATELAILIIKNCANISSIDVVGILGKQNDEREFILPRNLQLRVLQKQEYSPIEFPHFIADNNLQEEIHPQELIDIYGVNSITVYEVEPIEQVAENQ